MELSHAPAPPTKGLPSTASFSPAASPTHSSLPEPRRRGTYPLVIWLIGQFLQNPGFTVIGSNLAERGRIGLRPRLSAISARLAPQDLRPRVVGEALPAGPGDFTKRSAKPPNLVECCGVYPRNAGTSPIRRVRSGLNWLRRAKGETLHQLPAGFGLQSRTYLRLDAGLRPANSILILEESQRQHHHRDHRQDEGEKIGGGHDFSPPPNQKTAGSVL